MVDSRSSRVAFIKYIVYPVDVIDFAISEQGATAFDETDGDLTSEIVTSGACCPFDTSDPGIFSVFFDVADSAGNQVKSLFLHHPTTSSSSCSCSSF